MTGAIVIFVLFDIRINLIKRFFDILLSCEIAFYYLSNNSYDCV